MSHWYNRPGRKALRAIPADKLAEWVGKSIHLDDGNPAMVYRLIEVRGERIIVSTGRSSRLANAADARYLRKHSN